jgi:hypothetical protein
MGGNKQVSGLIHAAAASGEVRLWVPVMCLLEAERERAGIVGHVGVLVDVLHVIDDDYAMAVTIAGLCRGGVPFGVGAAVHAARPNHMLPEGASRRFSMSLNVLWSRVSFRSDSARKP